MKSLRYILVLLLVLSCGPPPENPARSAPVIPTATPTVSERIDLSDNAFDREPPLRVEFRGEDERVSIDLGEHHRGRLFGLMLAGQAVGYRLIPAAEREGAPDAYIVDARLVPQLQPRLLLLTPRNPGDRLVFDIIDVEDPLPPEIPGLPAGAAIPNEDMRFEGRPGIQLGAAAAMIAAHERGLALDMFLFGAFTLIAFSYLILYVTRRSERSFLLFGVFCLLAAVVILLAGSRAWVSLIDPQLRWSLHAIVVDRVQGVCIALAAPVFLDLVYEVFGEGRKRIIVRGAYVVAILVAVAALVLPPLTAITLLFLYRFVVLAEALWILYVLFRAWRMDRPGARLTLPGVLLLASAGIFDMFSQSRAEPAPVLLFAPALGVFVLIQAAMLSRRFAWAFAKFESLSNKLNRSISSPDDIQTLHMELDAARTIQQSLIPAVPPEVEHASIAARYRTMQIVGGDFYDFRTGTKTLGVLMADVSGHGIPAALIVSMVKLAFWLQKDQLPAPGSLFSRMNDILLDNIRGEFVTACYVWIDFDRMELKTSNAGHPPLLIWKASERSLIQLRPNGRLLGLLPNPEYEVQSLDLEPGDRIVLYTDGVYEAPAADGSGNQYGLERFLDFVRANARLSPDRFADELMDTLINWCGHEDRIADDIALVVIDIEGSALQTESRVVSRGNRALQAVQSAWQSLGRRR